MIDDCASFDELCDEPPALVVVSNRNHRHYVSVKHGERKQHVAARPSERFVGEVAIRIDAVEDRQSGARDVKSIL